MREVATDYQVEITGERPIQVNTCIEVSIHAGADSSVIGIIIIVIRLPSGGNTEIPFVIERKARIETRDACTLK